ncbi:MAG TPA: cation diffusion facilitator family transporter [Candidatus Limnocylindria bacterium]|nr:cation diffusion facilitator family transporter [Candidatus Limnocylindria bacterium]
MSHTRRSPAHADRARLLVVLGTASALFALELAAGILTNSLALIADAGHVLTDALGVGLALVAITVAARAPSPRRTFGYQRLEILAAVVNALVLLAVAVYVLLEAARRLRSEPEILGLPMLAVATVGLGVNLFAVWLLRGAAKESLNMRGAYLEVLSDALGSAAVIAAALVITFTGFTAADAIASVLIGLLIVPRTWSLLREALDVLLEATPKGVDMAEVRRHILEAPGVRDVHDLHVWAITSGMNVVSAHVIVQPNSDAAAILDHLCRCLGTQFDIDHSTFQLETADRRPLETAAHR